MNTDSIPPNQSTLPTQTFGDEGPKVGFLEAFYGILFAPKKSFEELYNEDSFTVVIYGMLAVFLSNLGKIEPGAVTLLNIIGVEFIGFISWFFVGLLLIFLGTVFKTPNNNFGRLLGFTGLANLPFLLMVPVNLLDNFIPYVFEILMTIVSIWAFVLFWIALAKSFQLEAWRVLLMAIIPFLFGIFLFAFLLANIFGLMFMGLPM